ERDPALVFYGLGAVHALALIGVRWLPRFPPRHGSGAHDHDPDEAAAYRRLLSCFRLLLMGSYILHSAMTPLLPARFEQLSVSGPERVLYASAWMGARILAFAVLERWHGWHGRRRTLVWAGGSMALGFAGVLLAPGPWWAVGALVVLGAGIGSAYAAALYYAMEVGDAQVDAGGAHEAMIGIGYTGGPLAALLAVGAADVGLIGRGSVDAWVLGSVGAVGLAVGVVIVRRARRPLDGA
ncbi:MAG: MFS transporter, partial [Planctomycetota bacterium]